MTGEEERQGGFGEGAKLPGDGETRGARAVRRGDSGRTSQAPWGGWGGGPRGSAWTWRAPSRRAGLPFKKYEM